MNPSTTPQIPTAVSRRSALTAGGVALAAGVLGTPDRAAAHDHAEATAEPTQGAGFYRSYVGDIDVTLISDGWFPMDPLPIVPPDESNEALQAALKQAHVTLDHQIGHVNALLVKSGDVSILVDTGCGTSFGNTTGLLPGRLAALGVDPAGLTGVLLTHVHPDHVGGLIGPTGKAFGDVPVMMLESEKKFWEGETDLGQMLLPEEMKQGMAEGMTAGLKEIAGRVEVVKDTAELAPGVRVLPLPGHTPGHCGLLITSGDDTLLYITDLLHFPPVQMAHPSWKVRFDAFPEEAAVTRKKILDDAAAQNLRVAGAHLSFPGFGHVDRIAGGFRFVPEVWKW